MKPGPRASAVVEYRRATLAILKPNWGSIDNFTAAAKS